MPTEEHRKLVKSWAGYGIHKEDIARAVPCSVPTLEKYFERELAMGPVETNARVIQNLLRMATSPTHPRAAISAFFWLKCQAGWVEASEAATGAAGKKQAQKDRAEKASKTGRFATPATPPKLVVNNNGR